MGRKWAYTVSRPNGWGIAAIFVNGDNCVVKGLGKVYQRGYAVQIVGNNNRVIASQIDGPLHAAVSVSGYMAGPRPRATSSAAQRRERAIASSGW